jgi:hypothetical protein
VKALASFVSLATLVALVTATGGAIVWVRFSAAELPAEHILRLTPKDDLVSIGAIALGLFAAAGVAAVVLAYLLDRWGSRSLRTIRVLVTLAAAGMLYAAAQLNESGWFKVGVAASIVVLAVGVLALFRVFGKGVEGTAARRPARDVDEPPKLWTLRPAGVWAVVAVVAVGALVAWGLVDGWFAVLLAIAALIVGVDLVLARETEFEFRWFGVAVFVSVALFGAVLSVLVAYDAPRLQPAAILRSSDQGGGGIAALYVGDTSDRIYLAHVDPQCRRGSPTDAPERGTGRVFWIPRDDVIGVAIGTPQRLGQALARAPLLLEGLQASRPAAAVTPAAPPAGPAGSSTPAVGSADATPALPSQLPVRQTLARVCPPDKPLTPPFEGTEVTGDEAATLARQFRPWLLFDTGEKWRPLSIDALFRERYANRPADRHRLCSSSSLLEAGCSDVTNADDFTASIQTALAPARRTFLDINGDLDAKRYCAPRSCGETLLDCDDCPASAIYYRVNAANGRFYVDYWWFLRFNEAKVPRVKPACQARLKAPRCFDHEGDWEGITVVTSAEEPYTVEFASYAAHDGIQRYPRTGLTRRAGSERALVFVASGTHAAYPKPCPSPPSRKNCGQDATIFGIRLPEARHDGLAGWARNEDEACFTGSPCLLPFPTVVAPAVAWHTWDGSWGSCHRGKSRCALGQGPESPSNQRRFQNPTCFGPRKKPRCDPVTPVSPTEATG